MLLPLLLVTLATPLPDRGVFDALTPKAQLGVPAWLAPTAPSVRVDPRTGVAVLRFDGLPVHAWAAQPGDPLPPAVAALPGVVVAEGPPRRDRDRDGLPDLLDLRLGARKAALNGARYVATYEKLSYPNGDVSPQIGVCTDVVVRAMRNAGIDLQVIIHKDMARHPKRYGLAEGRKGNPHIDHRRVRRLLPWFKATHRTLPTAFDPKATGAARWLPGDVVFMDTLGGPGADHVGLVSDRAGRDGRPLIINNWTDGYRTQDMALLGSVPVTHRFRLGLRR